MNATEIISELRAIRRELLAGEIVPTLAIKMLRLEDEIAGRENDDFSCDVLGYDTILSYIAKTNPEAMELIDDPVHGTVCDGLAVSNYLRERGVPILKVAPCAHIKRRYPKVEYVNAYPTSELAAYFG